LIVELSVSILSDIKKIAERKLLKKIYLKFDISFISLIRGCDAIEYQSRCSYYRAHRCIIFQSFWARIIASPIVSYVRIWKRLFWTFIWYLILKVFLRFTFNRLYRLKSHIISKSHIAFEISGLINLSKLIVFGMLFPATIAIGQRYLILI